MIYILRHFSVQELVPPHVYADRGEKAIELLDNRLLILVDELREEFGACTINDWAWGGEFKESGFRTIESKYYSPYSQHSLGRAADLKFKNVSAPEVQAYLLDHHHKFKYLTFLELGTPTWTHVDVRNCKKLTTWSPVGNE